MSINTTLLHYHSDDWMNDPILFFWQEEYHVFYQYRTPRHWGHIKSTDLIHWEQLPVALSPGSEGPDAAGCWTGCCLYVNGQFHIFYTGVQKDTGIQTVCHATSNDLVNWEKDPRNPLVLPGEPYAEKGAFRDPCIWYYDKWWYMALSASLPKRPKFIQGCVALLRSKNLSKWEFMNPLYKPEGMAYCECPDIFKIDNKYIMLFSCGQTFVAFSDNIFGLYKLNPYMPKFDGGLSYAVKTLIDDKDRRLGWGFIQEPWGWNHNQRPEYQQWSSSLTFPRVLSIDKDTGEYLKLSFPKEIESFRQSKLDIRIEPCTGVWKQGSDNIADGITGIPSNESAYTRLNTVKGNCLEISVRLTPINARKTGICIRCTEDLNEVMGIYIDKNTNSLCIGDLGLGFETKISGGWKSYASTYLPDTGNEHIDLRVIVDGSIIEVCANDSVILTSRCYTNSENAIFTGLFTVGGSTEFSNIEAWKLGI